MGSRLFLYLFDLAEPKYGLRYCIIQASDYIFICKSPKGKAASTHTPSIFSSFKESQLHASWRDKPDKRGPIQEGSFLTNWISTFRILLLNQRCFVSWNSIFKKLCIVHRKTIFNRIDITCLNEFLRFLKYFYLQFGL